jgi:AbrB family looped-hinge helix DNA binding protein
MKGWSIRHPESAISLGPSAVGPKYVALRAIGQPYALQRRPPLGAPSCDIWFVSDIIISHYIEVRPMTVVTISSRFQVVIPKDVRERLKLQPGQQVEAIPFKGRIELIPLEPIETMRGFLRGIDTTVPREADRV